MNENEKRVAMIPEDIFNAVIEFLLSKPYGEVAQLVDGIKGNVQIANVPSPEEVSEKIEQGGTI